MSLRNIPLITGLPFDLKPVIDITDQLPYRENDPNPKRKVEEITHVSVHHSAVEGGTPQGYANHHVNTLKWFHIGYHDVIKGDQIYQTNDLLTFSYHTSGNNDYTVGISISGDLSKRLMSDTERNCLYGRLLTYLSIFPKLTIDNIWGHNEFPNNDTKCPCIDMNRVRSDMNDLQKKMQRKGTKESSIARAYEVANQALFMYNQSKLDDGDGVWARHWSEEVYAIMKSKNLL